MYSCSVVLLWTHLALPLPSPVSSSFAAVVPASPMTYYIVDNRIVRPLDRSVQAQRSRARRATALPQPCVVRPGSRLCASCTAGNMQSALQTALVDAMTASESRRGEGESDGGEVCLVLLIVLRPFSFRLQRLGRARKEDPLSRTGAMATSKTTSAAGPAEKTSRSVSWRHDAAAASCSFGLTRSCSSSLPLSLSLI